MTTVVTESTGARARQTYFWRVRNGRTKAPAGSAEQSWHIQPGHPGGAYSDVGHELHPTVHHTPTLLSRTPPSGSRAQPEEFRGGCLTCNWEGPVRRGRGSGDGDNEVVEDAHDHAFPGWRTLPSVVRVADRWEVPGDRRRWARLSALYPTGWVDDGAPILVRRRFRSEVHAPPHRRRLRYELRIEAPIGRAKRATDQGALF
ncbi:DUF6349 family protein [Streptomyces exfoliatus]|uniref:DUF6349 family protein n=1 Tax=Streptomyces exfoliatus TaxID=1905 RepID=UPI0004658470